MNSLCFYMSTDAILSIYYIALCALRKQYNYEASVHLI